MKAFEIHGEVDLNNQSASNSLDNINNKADKVARNMQEKFEKIGNTFSKIGQGMTNVGTKLTTTLTLGVGGLVGVGIKYNMQMENFRMNLTTLLGSSEKADKLLKDLQGIASTTPYETDDLIDATQTMIGFGISAEDSQKYLMALGDISMGNSEKLKGLSLAFSQVQSTGKLTGQDLNQMINQGFNPLKFISEKTGESMAELKERMADGGISAKEVAEAFEYATSKGKPFYKGMENGSKTVSGRISTLKDNIMILIGKITESLLPTFEKIVDKLIAITEKFSNLSQEQKEQVLKWAGIIAAIGPVLMIVGKLTSGLGTLFSIIGKIKGAGGIAGLTAKLGPLVATAGPVIGVIAGIVAGLVLLVHALGGPKKALEKLKQAFEKVKEVISSFLEKINFKDKLQAIKDKFGELSEKLKGLKDLFKVLGTIAGTLLVPVITAISGVFNGLLNVIGPLIDWFGSLVDALSGIGEVLVGIFTLDGDKILGGLKKIFDGLVGMVKAPFKIISEFVKGYIDGARAFLSSLYEKLGLQKVVDTIKNKISEWWTSFVNAIKTAWNNICSFFSGIAEWINTNVVQPTIKFFKSLWNGIKKVFDGIVTTIKLAIEFIVGIIEFAFDLITLPFRLIWEVCKGIVETIWDKIGKKVMKVVNSIKDTIKKGFNVVKNFISNTFNTIKTIITNVWNIISNFVMTIVNAIKDRIVATFNVVKDFISNVMGTISSVISSIWNGIKNVVSTIVNGIKNVVINIFNAIRTKVTSIVNTIKSVITSVFNAIKSVASKVWNGIKNVIINPIKNAYNSVKSTVGNIKNKVVSVFNSIKTKVSSIWNGIKDKITKPIKDAKDKVLGWIGDIKKGFTNFKAKIKLPHFKIKNASLNPADWIKNGVPKLSIDWYSKAMNFGKILNGPTIFGMNNKGQLLGGGERGSETVVGTSPLMNMIKQSVSSQNMQLEAEIRGVREVLLAFLPLLANKKICLDSGELVGALTSKMDKSFGVLAEKKGRGR